MSKVHLTQCPVCSGNDLLPHLQVRDHSISGEDFELLRCSSCNLVMTQDAPDQSTIGPYYESDEYISHSDTKQGLVNRLYHMARDFMLGSKRRTVESFQRAGGSRSMVDYGAGTGYFLDHMSRAGWKTFGVEPSDSGRDFARSSFGLEVMTPESFYADFGELVGVVTMWHVLEHVHDLDGCLIKMNSILEKRGALVIAVPNYTSSDGGHYQEYWAAYDVPRHLWHFTPGAMKRLVEKHGFKLEGHKTMPLDAFYVSLLSEKYQQHSMTLARGFLQGLGSWMGGLGNSTRSSSVIYLFRKDA